MLTRSIQIRGFERELNILFPITYRQFLLKHGSDVVDGYRILGIPTKKGEPSVLEATFQLRTARPDLARSLIAVSPWGERVMCLDTERGEEGDCQLVVVDAASKDPPVNLDQTLAEWLAEHREYERRFKLAYARMKRLREEVRRKRQERGRQTDKQVLPYPNEWHPIVSKVEDRIVGLIALRHNPFLRALEVDEFYAADLAGMAPGAAMRNLVAIVCTFARDFSGSLEIVFTQDRRDGRDSMNRPTRQVPRDLAEFAEQYGVAFSRANEGRITHDEAVQLFWAILKYPESVTKRMLELERAGYLSRELIAEVVVTDIWSREEALWILENAPRPEAVLLGTDLPENRIPHAESLDYGRAAFLAKRLHHAVRAQISEGFSSEEHETPLCLLESHGEFWTLDAEVEFTLPWVRRGRPEVRLTAGEKILILSRPRHAFKPGETLDWITAQVERLKAEKERLSLDKACLILSYDLIGLEFDQDKPAIYAAVDHWADNDRVWVVFSYNAAHQLDLDVEERLHRSRSLRRFPARQGQPQLRILPVAKTHWTERTGFRHVVRGTIRFGKLATSGVRPSRYRPEYVVSAAAVERIGFQVNKAEAIFTTGAESQAVIEALTVEGGARHGFIQPEKVAGFVKRLPSSLQPRFNQVAGGLVMAVVPYEGLEAPLEPANLPTVKVALPEKITAQIGQWVAERLQAHAYISLEQMIHSAHEQIQTALTSGRPLPVSSFRPQELVETLRDYIIQPQEMGEVIVTPTQPKPTQVRISKSGLDLFFSRLFGASTMRVVVRQIVPPPYPKQALCPVIQPAHLRLMYNDGCEGEPFPLFCLSDQFQMESGLYVFPVQLVSLRHMLADYATEACIIRNVEIQRKEDSAEQEAFAYRKVVSFVETMLALVQKTITVAEAEERYSKLFGVLWDDLGWEKLFPLKGLELHLFQSTGLDPAVIGAYRAVTELLIRHRGRLKVVPRIYRPNPELDRRLKAAGRFDQAGRREIVSAMYQAAEPWC